MTQKNDQTQVIYTKKGFQEHGRSFQEKLVYAVLTDKAFSDRIGEILEVNYIEFKYLQLIVKAVYDYKEKYKNQPTISSIATIIKTSKENISEVIKESIRSFFIRFFKENQKIDDIEFVKETAINFCRKQAVLSSLAKCVGSAETFSFDQIEKEITKSLKLGVDNNIGHDFVEDFDERYEEDDRKVVPTGWKNINELLDGGLGMGELGIVIGGTGMGKSMVLVDIGAKALLAGKNVVYYTLELNERQIGRRFDACIAGFRMKDILASKNLQDKVKEKVEKIKAGLKIKQYPSGFATTTTIKNHFSKMRSIGFDADVIIVDYGDLLKPTNSYNVKRHGLEEVFTELRGLAIDFGIPLWTASQSNRDSVISTDRFIGMEGISEAYAKNFVADFVLTIKRTPEDKAAGLGTFFIAKNRQGFDGMVFPIIIDTSRVYIDVLDRAEEEPTATGCTESNIKRMVDEAKEKFKQGRLNA